MSQLTIHGLDARTLDAIRALARRQRISMSSAARQLIDQAAGLIRLPPPGPLNHSLDHLAGTWTEEEASEFMASIQSCEQVDPAMWAVEIRKPRASSPKQSGSRSRSS